MTLFYPDNQAGMMEVALGDAILGDVAAFPPTPGACPQTPVSGDGRSPGTPSGAGAPPPGDRTRSSGGSSGGSEPAGCGTIVPFSGPPAVSHLPDLNGDASLASAGGRGAAASVTKPSTEEEYKGSRTLRQRFEYKENSTAGFVELAPGHIPSAEEFFQALESAPDVERVERKAT